MKTADVSAKLVLQEGVKMGMPGDNLTVNLEADFPVPISIGDSFAMREGGRTVAVGIVSKLNE